MECWLSLGFLILLTGMHAASAGELPDMATLYEAEAHHIKQRAFRPVESIHVSGGQFIAGIESTQEMVEIFRSGFPQDGKAHSIWVRSAGLDLELASPGLGRIVRSAVSGDWGWRRMARVSRDDVGAAFSIRARFSRDHGFTRHGLDCVLLVRDPEFTPSGVYAGYNPPDEGTHGPDDAVASRSGDAPVPEDRITVFPWRRTAPVSPYLASANAHSPRRHLIDSSEWDETMAAMFSRNLIMALVGMKKDAGAEEGYWDFESLDAFVTRAKTAWGVTDVMIALTWRLGSLTGKQGDFTEADLATGRTAVMELVRRYGVSDSPLFIKYWCWQDEWTCGGYWRRHVDRFIDYFVSMVEEIKAFNPDIEVGGPMDCWPNDEIIAALLKGCPELDFINWNLFVAGRADTPLRKLFDGTRNYGLYVASSRELSRKILGRELPVFCSSYGPNYHAWDPPDVRLAEPVMGVWNALALSRLAEAGAAGGLWYDTRAANSGGLFGPRDPYALRSGMLSAAIDAEAVHIRPAARMSLFFKEHISGTHLVHAETAGDTDRLSVLAAARGENITVVLVNGAQVRQKATVIIDAYQRPVYSGRDLPDVYLYCDRQKVLEGQGLLFSNEGKAEFDMPPYSSWCVSVRTDLPRYDAGADRIELNGTVQPRGDMPALHWLALNLGGTHVHQVGGRIIHTLSRGRDTPAGDQEAPPSDDEKLVFTYSPEERTGELYTDLVINGSLVLGTLDNSYRPDNARKDPPHGSPDEILNIADGRRIINNGGLVLNESVLTGSDETSRFHFAPGGREFIVTRSRVHGFASPIQYEHGSMKVRLVDSRISGFSCVIRDPWASYGSAAMEVRGCYLHDGNLGFYIYHGGARKVFEDNVVQDVDQTFAIIADEVAVTNMNTTDNRLRENAVLTEKQWLTVRRGRQTGNTVGIKLVDRLGRIQLEREDTFGGRDEIAIPAVTRIHRADKNDEVSTTVLGPFVLTVTFDGRELCSETHLERPEIVTLE